MAEPASISDEEYHELADGFIETLVAELEGMQESGDEVDVEYSVRPIVYDSADPPSARCFPSWPKIDKLYLGRCDDREDCAGHLRFEQTATEQADLVKLAYLRSKTLRLGSAGRLDAPKGRHQ